MDLPVTYGVIRDESSFSQDGTITNYKLAPFFIGKHGPFLERLPASPDWGDELARRVAAIKQTLERLPT